jgi:hypothetical protein
MHATMARLAMAIIQGINLLNNFAALLLLSGAGYLTAFEPNQLHTLVMLFLNARNYGCVDEFHASSPVLFTLRRIDNSRL